MAEELRKIMLLGRLDGGATIAGPKRPGSAPPQAEVREGEQEGFAPSGAMIVDWAVSHLAGLRFMRIVA